MCIDASVQNHHNHHHHIIVFHIFSFRRWLPLPFIVAFSLTLAVEVKVDKYEVPKLVGVVVIVVLLVAVVEIGVLELFVMCSVEIVHAKDVDVDITVVVVVEEPQVMRRTMRPRREMRKRARRSCSPIWIRLYFNKIRGLLSSLFINIKKTFKPLNKTEILRTKFLYKLFVAGIQ